jgi:hypothetical protein
MRKVAKGNGNRGMWDVVNDFLTLATVGEGSYQLRWLLVWKVIN